MHEATPSDQGGAQRLRVMMIAPHFEEYALGLSRALAATCTVLLATDQDRLRRDYANRAFPDTGRVELRDARFRSPFDALRLIREVIAFRPDVIHLQEPSGMRKALVCALLVLITHRFCRIALTVHDPQPHEGRDHAIAQRLERYRRYMRRKADVVFVHGAFCRAQYLAVRERESQPVVAIDHGELLADAPPTPRGDAPFTLLCFGRMEAYKGVGVLLEALRILERDGAVPRVVVAGSGPELDEVADGFAALPNVTVENAFVPSSRLIEALRDADAVAMPYLEATQSGVLAAALANGRFVIASKVGGIPDVIEHEVNGLLSPPGDAAALASAIRRAAGDPALRRRLGEGAVRTAQERLTWDKVSNVLIAAY